jgi:hypothetical protein
MRKAPTKVWLEIERAHTFLAVGIYVAVRFLGRAHGSMGFKHEVGAIGSLCQLTEYR